MLTTQHNLSFLQSLVMAIRRSIGEGKFRPFKERYLERYGQRARERSNGSPADQIGLNGGL